ncbi:MAG: CHAT domain-containing protein, partial [Chloroflexi bacterium]|nr:CHAT domain-containing protein [Chloroflexota bacterium]
MSLTLQVTSQNGQIFVRHQDDTLGVAPVDSLPNWAEILENPFTHGPRLFEILGGQALLNLLNADPNKLLYLDIPLGDPADTIPWECAIVPPRTFLVHRFGFLRLVNQELFLDKTPAPLRLVALGADALVDRQGNARDTYRLDILQEMQQIEYTLAKSGQEIAGIRVAPTPTALQSALSDGRRTILHLSCHGSIIDTDHGPQPVLHLEDENGGPEKLVGDDLISLTALADLRLILLSACRMGQNIDGGYGRLTRALVEQGVPAAIGMQGLFPDDLSDDLAAILYQSLLNGQPLGKAMQAARLALRKAETAVGLPVCYVAQGGDDPLPLQAGRPGQQRLDLSQHCRLPTGVQLPDPFVGRNAELHALAQLAQETKVITIIGAGGMGKTALAAAFVRRFALRYQDGVLGYSFAANEVDAGAFRRELLLRLAGDELADQAREQQEQTILDALRTRDLLLLVDNYESVQQSQERSDHPYYAEGKAVHDLLKKIASNGGRLLLTSRQQPAGLKGERIFPGKDHLLQGVNERAAAELFYLNSPRALQNRRDPAVQELARAVGRVTAGHPLAVALLGSEYDHRDAPAERFLDLWEAELQAARSQALDDHHATFATAFNRSFAALSEGAQGRLQAISLIPFPFFDTGAAMLWALDDKDDEEL